MTNRKLADNIDSIRELVEAAVNHHNAMTLSAVCPASKEDLARASSPPEVLRLAVRLLGDYEGWMHFAEYLRESARIAECLTDCMTSLATAMPCPMCGHVLTEDGCGNCCIALDDLPTLSTRNLPFDRQGNLVTLYDTIPHGSPEFDELLRRCHAAFLDRWYSVARAALVKTPVD